MNQHYEINLKGAVAGLVLLMAVAFFPGTVRKWLDKRQAGGGVE